ncbi:MAG: (2Fe-2S)-binding protein [Acidobacteriota bacterium]|nr:(2Fe-2S)-binding protein [Acidobacteriota bacterium]
MPRKHPKKPPESTSGVSRRDFISSASLGTLGIVTARGAQAAATSAESPIVEAGERIPVRLSINGRAHRLLVEPRWSLAYVLREEIGLTGAKLGCGRGECGSCTVLMDDTPRYACMTLAVEAEGAEIATLEGLLVGEELGAVQQAFAEHDAFQCGYCTPGQVMAVEGLLRANADPSLDDIRLGVSGNLCRCGAYPNIFKAAKLAGEIKRGGNS